MGNLPFKPDPAAVGSVKNVLPAPTECRYCGSGVALVNNKEMYGRCIGLWPWAYKCTGCDAYVGLHPKTAIPLGTLANASLRAHRSAFKGVFNQLWVASLDGRWSRTRAYKWLADTMKIPVNECHGAWFDEAQCIAATQYCRVQLSRWYMPPAVKKDKPDDQTKNHQQGGVPDWFDERNQYIDPHDGRAVQGDSRQAAKGTPGQRGPTDRAA